MYLLCNWNMSDAAGMDDFGEFEPRNLSYKSLWFPLACLIVDLDALPFLE